MKRYLEYKESGVDWIGEIPANWEIKKLKYIAKILPSNVDKHIFPDEIQVRLCNYTDVYYNDYITVDTVLKKGSCKESEFEKFVLRKGDVIITKDSETPDDIGVPTFVKDDLDNVVCGYHLTMVRPSACRGKYIFRFIQSDRTRKYFELESNGITRYGLGKPSIENLFVPIPTDSEQRSITNFLDRKTEQIDELIRIKQRHIELLQEQRTALINQAVTKGLDPDVEMKPSGVEWIEEIPKHWCKVTVGNLGKVITGYTPPTQNIEYFGNKYPFITPTDIMTDSRTVQTERFLSQKGYEYNKSRLLPENSVCVTCIASIGKICMTTVPSITNQQINSVIVNQDKYNSCFVYYLLKNTTDKIQSVANSATTPIVNKSTFVNINICVPPLNEQTQIANFLDQKTKQIDELIAVENQKIQLLKEYRQSLISEAVTGKIDVRNEV